MSTNVKIYRSTDPGASAFTINFDNSASALTIT